MNKGMLTVGMIILAVMALVLINVITSYSTGSELDYYLVKETAEAAMDDAIDIKYYRDNGTIRMDSEKFVENFLIRFANSVDNTRNYKIGFYDLNEVPPKVSIKVDSATRLNFDGSNILMSTTYDGIVESIDVSRLSSEERLMVGLNDAFVRNSIADGTLGKPVQTSGNNGEEYTQ